MSKEFMKKLDCEKSKANCYQFNLKPMMDKIDKLDEKIERILIQLAKISERIKPLEKIVYGLVGLILSTILLSIIYLVIKK